MIIMEVDFHPGLQQMASVDTDTGEFEEKDWASCSPVPGSLNQANPQPERNGALHGVHAAVPFKKHLTPPEEKQILDNPETIIPAETREKILEESGGSREELREQLREQLTKLMGGHAGPFSIAYSYDAQGRVQQTRRRIFNGEDGDRNYLQRTRR